MALPELYPFLPETPLFLQLGLYIYMRRSKIIYPALSESTPPSQNIPPALFYNVILTESTPLSCLDKCACSRRRIYRAYISSLVTQCVQCIKTVTVPPTGVALAVLVADPGSEEGGAQGVGGLPPRFFGTFYPI